MLSHSSLERMVNAGSRVIDWIDEKRASVGDFLQKVGGVVFSKEGLLGGLVAYASMGSAPSDVGRMAAIEFSKGGPGITQMAKPPNEDNVFLKIEALNQYNLPAAGIHLTVKGHGDEASALTDENGEAALSLNYQLTSIITNGRAPLNQGVVIDRVDGNTLNLQNRTIHYRIAPKLNGIFLGEATLYNNIGQKVAECQLDADGDNITLQNLATGIYFLNIQSNDRGTVTQKLLLGGNNTITLTPSTGKIIGHQEPNTTMPNLTTPDTIVYDLSAIDSQGVYDLFTEKIQLVVGQNERKVELVGGSLIHGVVENTIGDTLIKEGNIVIEANGQKYPLPIGLNGEFGGRIPAVPDSTVKIYPDSIPGATTNTYTVLRREGVISDGGIIGTAVNVYGQTGDTLAVTLDKLTVGLRIRPLANQHNHEGVFQLVRGGPGNDGVTPYIRETRILLSLTHDENGDPLTPERVAMHKEAALFFHPLSTAPLGAQYVISDTMSSPVPFGQDGYITIHVTPDGQPGNVQYPPGESYTYGASAFTPINNPLGVLISEAGEAMGLRDTDSGSNDTAFKGDGNGQIIGLSIDGAAAWAIAHTYDQRDFQMPPEARTLYLKKN